MWRWRKVMDVLDTQYETPAYIQTIVFYYVEMCLEKQK
jgi:hypothetical protein